MSLTLEVLVKVLDKLMEMAEAIYCDKDASCLLQTSSNSELLATCSSDLRGETQAKVFDLLPKLAESFKKVVEQTSREDIINLAGSLVRTATAYQKVFYAIPFIHIST